MRPPRAVAGLPRPFWVLWVGTLINRLGTMVASVGATIVADLAPGHMRGRYNGVFGLAWGAAGLLAPTLSTRLLAVNHWSLWVVCAVLCGAASVAQLAIADAVRERSHAAINLAGTIAPAEAGP